MTMEIASEMFFRFIASLKMKIALLEKYSFTYTNDKYQRTYYYTSPLSLKSVFSSGSFA